MNFEALGWVTPSAVACMEGWALNISCMVSEVVDIVGIVVMVEVVKTLNEVLEAMCSALRK